MVVKVCLNAPSFFNPSSHLKTKSRSEYQDILKRLMNSNLCHLKQISKLSELRVILNNSVVCGFNNLAFVLGFVCFLF